MLSYGEEIRSILTYPESQHRTRGSLGQGLGLIHHGVSKGHHRAWDGGATESGLRVNMALDCLGSSASSPCLVAV